MSYLNDLFRISWLGVQRFCYNESTQELNVMETCGYKRLIQKDVQFEKFEENVTVILRQEAKMSKSDFKCLLQTCNVPYS